MTVLENMQAVLPSLPKNERKAAEYLLNYPHDIQRRSAEVIAQDAGISRSAIVRLCQKLGYQGWSEFKYAGSGGFCTGAQHPDPVRKHYPKAPSRGRR